MRSPGLAKPKRRKPARNIAGTFVAPVPPTRLGDEPSRKRKRKPRPRIDRGLDYTKPVSTPPEDEADLPPQEQADVEPQLMQHPDPPPRKRR